MQIEIAIRVCRQGTAGIFARPASWKGSGQALDLGGHVDPQRIRKVEPFGRGSLHTSSWQATAQEIAESWFLINLSGLQAEIRQNQAREKQDDREAVGATSAR